MEKLNWVNVNDGLPSEKEVLPGNRSAEKFSMSKDVFVTVHNEEYHKDFFATDYTQNGKWMHYNGARWDKGVVTHWFDPGDIPNN